MFINVIFAKCGCKGTTFLWIAKIFLYFCTRIFCFFTMKWLKKHLGMGMMAAGTAVFAALQLLHLTFVNVLLLLPLALIVAGAFLHVKLEGE